MTMHIIAAPWMPTDTALILSGGSMSEDGRSELWRRVAAGESQDVVTAEILVRERKATVVRFAPEPSRG